MLADNPGIVDELDAEVSDGRLVVDGKGESDLAVTAVKDARSGGG